LCSQTLLTTSNRRLGDLERISTHDVQLQFVETSLHSFCGGNPSRGRSDHAFKSVSVALRMLAFMLSTCSSRLRSFSRASRSSALSCAFSSASAPSFPPDATGGWYADVLRDGGALSCIGDSATGSGSGARAGAGAGADAGAGAGAGAGGAADEVDVGAGVEKDGAATAAVVTAPVSSETSFSSGVLPEKNSPALSDGSDDGAGGKMSAWKDSDYAATESDTCRRGDMTRITVPCAGR
jgi:hypothetical protein